ncbi:MAG: hypothetical protein FWG70_07110 [Oscillospiraceae bacterium]|nr:hypothetical protein [Oscillospiraceae bacterium]
MDILAAVSVLIVLGAVMVVAKLCARRLGPEGSRKTIHIVMGCTALCFPYIFQHKQTVVFLGIIAVSLLLFMRRNVFLRNGVGTALLSVGRKSLGDVYFVISIVMLFLLHNETYEYLIPVAVLTFADSVAALIGVGYGRYNMAQHEEEAKKSGEGSVMFFIVAFACTLIPLQLMTEVGRAEVLVISGLIGILAAMIEAVTRHGNDNLLLPLLTYSVLCYNVEQTLSLIFANLSIMLFFLAVVYMVRKITNISRLSMAYSLLVGYIVLMLGGISWVIPPLLLFLTFGIFPMMNAEEKSMIQTYKVIESNSIVGIICLVLTGFFPEYRNMLYISYSLSFAILLGINTYSRFLNFRNRSTASSIVWGLVKAIGFIALPSLMISVVPLSRWYIYVLYLAFTAIPMPFAVSLNRKYDYKKVGDATFNANKILVGGLVLVFTIILLLIGEYNGLF